MMKKLIFAIAILALSAIATAVFAQRQGTNTVSAKGRYLPEYTKEGDLILPENWRSWVYVGSPLTPDELNNGKASWGRGPRTGRARPEGIDVGYPPLPRRQFL
jgi:hypothetical protein